MDDTRSDSPAGVDAAIEEALDIARRALGMEAGYVTQFTADEQRYRAVAGDAESFSLRRDEGYPLDGTYCRRVVLGEIPNVVADAAVHPEVRDLAITRLGRIGAYIGVPITLSDGTVYGTVCAVDHEARPELADRDVLVLEAVARLLGAEIERAGLSEENAILRARVGGLETEIAELRAEVQAAAAEAGDGFVDARGWRPD
jgi:GAF domain-containing protein